MRPEIGPLAASVFADSGFPSRVFWLYGAAMRAPDIFEVVIAVGAAVTVVSAIVAILYRVTRGNADAERVEQLKAAFGADQKDKKH